MKKKSILPSLANVFKVISFFERKKFDGIRTFCLFVGYQRSGSSFLGSVLDAHEHMVVAMESDALTLVKKGFNKKELFTMLIYNSKAISGILKRKWTGYSYKVPNESQGKYTDLKVIGDKKAGRTTEHLGERPELLEELAKISGCKLKLIHPVRNPFDILSTMYTRNLEGETFDRSLMERKINVFFNKVAVVDQLKSNPENDILDVYHEEMIENPKKVLAETVSFLGLEASEEYLENCAAITMKKPNKSRSKVEWPEDLKSEVLSRSKEYSFLSRYTFDN